MTLRHVLFRVLAAAVVAGAGTAQAFGQSAPPKLARATIIDAAPTPESGAPDPLAPAEVDRPAPQAPGAPGVVTETAAQPAESDPIVAAVRQRLASLSPTRGLGDREDLAAVVAYYTTGASQAVWTDATGLTSKAQLVIAEIAKADDWGLKASAFDLPAALGAGPTAEALADAEIAVARAVLKYARHARGGRIDPASASRKFDQKPVIYDPKSVLQAVAATETVDAYLRGLHPNHAQFQRLQQALVAARSAPTAQTPAAKASIQQLLVNMERWRWMPPDLGAFYVLDSIPEQMTRVVDGGKVVLSEKIVVGKVSSPTPIFSADMQFVIFHPSWGVPSGIKTHELAPKLRATEGSGGGWFSSKPLASSFLGRHGLQVSRGGVPVNPDSVDWSSVDISNYHFTQAPGPTNVLGVVKFRFPNKHDVYMHDTSERHLFGGSVRAFSHGCMRVQNPIALAEVLLEHDRGWTKDKVQAALRSGTEVKLTTPIPVHVTYFTVWIDDAGAARVLPDLYGLDSRVASALEGREVQVASAKVAAVAEAEGAPIAPSRVTSRRSPRDRKPPVTTTAAFNPFNPVTGN